MTAYIVPQAFPVARVRELQDSIESEAYYLFAGDHRPSTNTDLPSLTQAVSNTYLFPWNQMLYGKRVTNACPGIVRIPYQSDKAFDRYDDTVDLSSRDWYAIVNAGSYSHVYVCLDNADGANSTVQPDFASAIAADDFAYRTSDGYRWMYLSTTDSATIANLATSDYFPIVANSTVQAAARPGAIDVFDVSFDGKRYDNYVSGTFQAADIKVDALDTLYQLSNSTIHSVNGYYQGCVIVITDGTGVGQFATIRDYFCTGNGNYANLDSSFPITPTNGSQFEVFPGIVVGSDGTQTLNVVARALINTTSSNSVHRIEVLEAGLGYHTYANASVYANVVVGVTSPATIRPILSPRGGHGSDPAEELGATVLLVGCALSNTEGNTIPANNTYRQFGLMKEPRFANVQLSVSGALGMFSSGETIQVLDPRYAASNAHVNTTSVVVTCDTRMFQSGDDVYGTDGNDSFVNVVNVVTNSTSMTLASNGAFASNVVVLSLAQRLANVVAIEIPDSGNVYVSNCPPTVETGLTLYGSASRVMGTISAITRNDVVKDFDTFVQIRKYRITSLGGSFINNEYVLQGNTSGLVHSCANGFLYVSNQTGPFTVPGSNFVGNTSGATASPTEAYDPEVIIGSGTIEYLEGIEPLTRADAQTEGFVIPYKF